MEEVLEAFHDELDSMEVQDMLLRHSWNTKKVIDYFKKKQVEPQTEKEETVGSQQPVQQQQATAPQNSYPSQETQLFKCPECLASFSSKLSLSSHKSWHARWKIPQTPETYPDSGAEDKTTIEPNKRHISDTPDESERAKSFQKKKKASKNSSSDADQAPQQPVFSSGEDSDCPLIELLPKKSVIVHLFNRATVDELTAIESCGNQRANVIVQLRPYLDWDDLKLKFQTTKPLAPELLDKAQEYVNRRNSLKTIMKKCKNIVEKLQRAVEAGANITRQPSMLNPK